MISIQDKFGRHSSKIFAGSVTVFIIGLILLMGPASAFVVSLGDFDNDVPVSGDVISTTATITINNYESINLNSVSLIVDGEVACVFNAYTGDDLGGCANSGITITPISTSESISGYGYGYGYSYGYGYGNSNGPWNNDGYYNTKFVYKIEIDTSTSDSSVFTPGASHEIELSTQLGTEVYTSTEKQSFSIGVAGPADNEIFDDVGFLLPAGEDDMTDIPNVTVNNDWTINVLVGTETAKVILPEGTTITMTNGSNLNVSAITASEVVLSTISGLTGLQGAIQFGIPSLGLTFSQPITIQMFVGTALNGQTLDVYRSSTGTDGWTQTGIESPKTCLVTNGVCEFQATQASYYASSSVATTPSSGSGGGWGSPTTSKVQQNAVQPEETIPTSTETGETNAPGEITRAPTGFGITGAAIGAALTSPAGIGTMILIGVVLVAGFMLIQRRKSKEDDEDEDSEDEEVKEKPKKKK